MDYPRFHLALPADAMSAVSRNPAGNHLEFKAFRNMDMLFATDGLDYP